MDRVPRSESLTDIFVTTSILKLTCLETNAISVSKLATRIGMLCALLFCAGAGSARGSSWTSHGPNTKTIMVVATSPQHANIVYAGAFGWGVFKSTDGGSSWTNYQNGFINTYLRSLLVLSDTVVYAGTNDGVFKTTDGGR